MEAGNCLDDTLLKTNFTIFLGAISIATEDTRNTILCLIVPKLIGTKSTMLALSLSKCSFPWVLSAKTYPIESIAT